MKNIKKRFRKKGFLSIETVIVFAIVFTVGMFTIPEFILKSEETGGIVNDKISEMLSTVKDPTPGGPNIPDGGGDIGDTIVGAGIKNCENLAGGNTFNDEKNFILYTKNADGASWRAQWNNVGWDDGSILPANVCLTINKQPVNNYSGFLDLLPDSLRGFDDVLVVPLMDDADTNGLGVAERARATYSMLDDEYWDWPNGVLSKEVSKVKIKSAKGAFANLGLDSEYGSNVRFFPGAVGESVDLSYMFDGAKLANFYALHVNQEVWGEEADKIRPTENIKADYMFRNVSFVRSSIEFLQPLSARDFNSVTGMFEGATAQENAWTKEFYFEWCGFGKPYINDSHHVKFKDVFAEFNVDAMGLTSYYNYSNPDQFPGHLGGVLNKVVRTACISN